MATTTNYGWTTPDDTDLVKDGAAAIRTLGSSIDTTTKNLNPETTTGDIAYRSATANTNTRLAIGSSGQVLTVAGGVPSWATPTTGDIEGVTAGTGISGGGTSGTVTITNSMATEITAKGDLIVGTGNAAFDNLAVGTNGHVLTADSTVSPTGLKWAAPAGGGKVIQAVFASTSTGASSSSSSYADTNLTATITPTSASNSIYVFVSQCGIIKSSANALNGLNLKLFRGATEIIFFGRNILYTGTAIQLNGSTASIVYKDSPATTSATTYKTQFASENNTATVYVNDSSATSTIVLMEVAP
jgi:hypothetical protein